MATYPETEKQEALFGTPELTAVVKDTPDLCLQVTEGKLCGGCPEVCTGHL